MRTRNWLETYGQPIRKFQEGGAMAAGEAGAPPAGPEAGMAPEAGGGADIETMLAEYAQSRDPQLAVAICDMLVEMMAGGAQAGAGGMQMGMPMEYQMGGQMGIMDYLRNPGMASQPMMEQGGMMKGSVMNQQLPDPGYMAGYGRATGGNMMPQVAEQGMKMGTGSVMNQALPDPGYMAGYGRVGSMPMMPQVARNGAKLRRGPVFRK